MIQPTTLSPALPKTALAGTPKAMTPVTSPMSTPHTNGTMSSPCMSLCPRSDRSRRIRPIVTEWSDVVYGAGAAVAGIPLARPGDAGIVAGVGAAGHSADHLAVAVESGNQHAVIAGHLFLHPAQVFAPGPRADLDESPEQAAVTRRALLARCAAEYALLIGPLFAEPGADRVITNGDNWRLEPAFG
jgi:glyoxylase-like metal-dependent hydrolase (beta-lactamase superfamily II)